MVTAIWIAIASLHLFSSYLDAIKYRGSYAFDVMEVTYYILAYHSWAIFSLVFFTAIKEYSQRFSPTILALCWFVTAILWLLIFLSVDTLLRVSILASVKQDWLTLLGSTSNAIIFFYFILYCVTTAVCIAIFYYRSSQQALIDKLMLEKKNTDSELKLTEMQLEQLQWRLSPHFLFNCLSSISALARNENKDTLISAIAQIGNLLRFCASSSTERFIPLIKELEFVDDYVALQTLRYPKLFSFEKNISHDSEVTLCPPFLLQPLIENSFIHGVDTTQTLTHIHLTLQISGNRIMATITNTRSFNSGQSSGLNSTISNFKERLQILYQSDYRLSLNNTATHFVVSLDIPALTWSDIDSGLNDAYD